MKPAPQSTLRSAGGLVYEVNQQFPTRLSLSFGQGGWGSKLAVHNYAFTCRGTGSTHQGEHFILHGAALYLQGCIMHVCIYGA